MTPEQILDRLRESPDDEPLLVTVGALRAIVRPIEEKAAWADRDRAQATAKADAEVAKAREKCRIAGEMVAALQKECRSLRTASKPD